MIATYHNHSTWSDGKSSPQEMLEAARAMGIDELGISDHWVLHPRGTQFKWAMPTNRLADYVSAMKALRESNIKAGGAKSQASPRVRIGLEVDWHPGNARRLRDVLEQYPFDYIIGSVHQIQLSGEPDRIDPAPADFMIDGSAAAWQPLSQDEVNAIHRQYWINMKSLAESGVFDIVAHMDLPKKFAFHANADLSQEIGEALDAIASATTPAGGKLVVEINTAGWHKPCDDAYPTLDILRECHRLEIPVTISADAHHPDHLLRDFDRAAERLANAGYAELARFEHRQARFEALR